MRPSCGWTETDRGHTGARGEGEGVCGVGGRTTTNISTGQQGGESGCPLLAQTIPDAHTSGPEPVEAAGVSG